MLGRYPTVGGDTKKGRLMKQATKMMASALVTTLVATGLALGSVSVVAKDEVIKEIPKKFWGNWGGKCYEPDGTYCNLTLTRKSVEIDGDGKARIGKVIQSSPDTITITIYASKANGGNYESTYTVRGNKLWDDGYGFEDEKADPFIKQR